MSIEIRRAAPDDWPSYREVRLASLRDSPNAFGATLERALTFDEADWRHGVEEPTWLAECDSMPVAMVRLTRDEEGRPHLSSMWVAPDARGQQVGERLVAALEDEVRGNGEGEIVLRVVIDNLPARRLYERLGYAVNGRRHRTSRGFDEVEMSKTLR